MMVTSDEWRGKVRALTYYFIKSKKGGDIFLFCLFACFFIPFDISETVILLNKKVMDCGYFLAIFLFPLDIYFIYT